MTCKRFEIDRIWTTYGLQNMNVSGNVLTMSSASSDVTLQPVPATGNGIVPEQNLVFQNGYFWNPDLNKYLSINTRVVKADLNDIRGAATWTIGKTPGSSVTRFGKISPLWKILDGLFFIWEIVEPTLSNLLYYWANLNSCKWPNIET